MDEEQDVRENVVRYDDEGGGEEDTEAFDMFTLRHSNQTNPDHFGSESVMYKNGLLQEFICDRLQEVDLDLTAPPYDSLQTYAFEGSGSAVESLISLSSSESEQDYGFLREWGPKFRRLADLYGHLESVGGHLIVLRPQELEDTAGGTVTSEDLKTCFNLSTKY